MISELKHVAIVMDGNGRWAKQRKWPRTLGHRAGAKAVKKAVQYAAEKKIQVLTLFALSAENKLSRSTVELNNLYGLFLEALDDNLDELHLNNIRVRIIGNRYALTSKLQRAITFAEQKTKENSRMTLVVALNYSGRWDITQATQKIAREVFNQHLNPNAISEELMGSYLSLSDLPPPDLLIRTSGEQRMSNFLLWQFAYTELFFTEVYWPDFNEAIFAEAIKWFEARQRRYGAVVEIPLEHCDA